MLCLMIRPKYVADILEGIKTIEYRSWNTNYRGDFFIGCCSTAFTRGYLAAVAELTDCKHSEQDHIYKWYLSNVRIIKPVYIRGQLRLFETGINNYDIINTDDEINAAYDEAEKWMIK